MWKRRSAPPSPDLRKLRFQAVLLAARRTRHYRRLLKAASLGTPEQILSLDSVEEALERLPRVDASASLICPEAFVNPEAPEPRLQKFYCPLPPPARTAILMPGFLRTPTVRSFPAPRRSRLARYRAEAVAGPVGVLRRLAEPVDDMGAPAPRVARAVIALSGLRHGFLSDEARELFWRVFQVPVFDQHLGPEGELLAWECEAHEGLHIRADRAIFELAPGQQEPELLATSLVSLHHPMLRTGTGLTGRIDYSPCACGLSTPRLNGLRRRVLNTFARQESLASASCAAD